MMRNAPQQRDYIRPISVILGLGGGLFLAIRFNF